MNSEEPNCCLRSLRGQPEIPLARGELYCARGAIEVLSAGASYAEQRLHS